MNHPTPASPAKPKPMGWLIGLAVLLITVGVIAGLIGIAVVAKRKQKYRIHDPTEPAQPTRPALSISTRPVLKIERDLF